jgi:CPA2 family monovalent cation:H+ antiporter-2
MAARNLNPHIKILVRTRYLRDRSWLEEVGGSAVASEEAEVAIGLASLLLREMGAEDEVVRRQLKSIRDGFKRKTPEEGL